MYPVTNSGASKKGGKKSKGSKSKGKGKGGNPMRKAVAYASY